MKDWTQGYITEIEYTAGFYRELAPSYLQWCALLRGHEPVNADKPFHYLEIGCGQGVSAAVLAAANPHGRFWAFDFNPIHVRHGQALAGAAQLDNLEYFEASFAEALERALPPMDIIALHGVYSWITPENREEIVALIRRFLKPGGMVYISYNCLPGWAGKAPVRKLMTEHAARSQGAMTERVMAARRFVSEIAKTDALYFKNHPTTLPLVEQLGQHSTNYLVHEYFNESWELLYHSDVVRELHGAKLHFIASATVLENFDEAAVPEAIRPIIANEKDPVLAELLRDFAANRQFRRDLFARGAQRLNAVQALERIGQLRFALARDRALCSPKIQVPLGEADLNRQLFEPIMDALSQGEKTASELAQAAGHPLQAILFMLSALMSAGHILPLLQPEPKPHAAQRLNRVLLERAAQGRELNVLAVPRAGTGFSSGLGDQLLLLGVLRKAADLPAFVHERLLALGRRLKDDNGQPITDDQLQLEKLRQLATDFRQKTLPIYQRLGCVKEK